MRVLVEQTVAEARNVVGRLKDFDQQRPCIDVYTLMGGADNGSWHLNPERCAILVGTQDMLLSRAMNRGYASPRARWPMEFGLLNRDCLWVMDEVQLMDVGLATSVQLQAFRDEDAGKSGATRPCRSWWMSATLQKNWLEKSPDTTSLTKALQTTTVPPGQRIGLLWKDVRKPCERLPCKETEMAKFVAERHLAAGRGAMGPTLVVVNRVERATAVSTLLRANTQLAGTDIELVHSRFRPEERKGWRDAFLNRAACAPGTDRIIVATQVVEAGVDISAGLLITELAPWPSLVQRFGRCARWGGSAQVIVADFEPSEKDAAPYAKDALDAARDALAHLQDVAPVHLEAFEEAHPELLLRLYPYDPPHLLLRHELDELFDTSPDLSGADIDISRFIRSGEERDVQVFWEDIAKGEEPPSELRPTRNALCAVPFLKARDWLCGKETANNKAPALKTSMRAWTWDWQDREWRRAERRSLYPGQTVLVAAACGGYVAASGWDPEHRGNVTPVAPETTAKRTKRCWTIDKKTGQLTVVERTVRAWSADEHADAGEDDETLSATQWQTIASHGLQVGDIAKSLASKLAPAYASLFSLAGRWHDAGKAHAAFQTSIKEDQRPARHDLAKAPEHAWPCNAKQLYRISTQDQRAGFRHELVSTLALFDVLRRHQPLHAALLGPWRELLDAARMPPDTAKRSEHPPNPLEAEVLALAPEAFNLLAYLVCAHHGKVRMAWHASPADQKANDRGLRIRGVRDGDTLPSLDLADASGYFHSLPASQLDLIPAAAGLNPRTGAGWTERVLGLMQEHGPFTLAWLEALLRAADMRGSREPLADPFLSAHDPGHELARRDSDLAPPAHAGEAAPALAEHSRQRGSEHGVRAGAGIVGDAGSGTRTPADATRSVDTALGRLSYTDLAPHLARAARSVESRIFAGEFDAPSFDEHLIGALHQALCFDLVPQLTGWRKHEVTVGAHTPPSFVEVPQRMRDYALDLSTRLSALPESPHELLLETLAFAEGRLLSIHPFADFNGRVTRLFLRWLTRRLDLPVVALAPESATETERYLSALRAADARNWQPLMAIWRSRFEQAITGAGEQS